MAGALGGGQVGFDEGGVFASLQDPVWSRKVTKTKYRHNKAGLVTLMTVTESSAQITGSQIIALAAGPALLAILARVAGLSADDTDKILATAIIGPFLGPAVGEYITANREHRKSVEDRGGWQLSQWLRDLFGDDE